VVKECHQNCLLEPNARVGCGEFLRLPRSSRCESASRRKKDEKKVVMANASSKSRGGEKSSGGVHLTDHRGRKLIIENGAFTEMDYRGAQIGDVIPSGRPVEVLSWWGRE